MPINQIVRDPSTGKVIVGGPGSSSYNYAKDRVLQSKTAKGIKKGIMPTEATRMYGADGKSFGTKIVSELVKKKTVTRKDGTKRKIRKYEDKLVSSPLGSFNATMAKTVKAAPKTTPFTSSRSSTFVNKNW
jgi:hypothetical protein